MPSKGQIAHRCEELRREVKEKTALFEADELTGAEFKSFMDKAESENEELAVAMKTFNRALGYAGSADPAPSGEPPAGDTPAQLKQYREGFAQLKSAASAQDRRRAEVSFDFGLKSRGEIGMKSQGIANMSGESTSGTTQPSALSDGSYFLGGTAGPFITPEFVPGIVDLRFYENVIASLMPSFAVESPVVTYVRESSWTNAAAGTWEGQTKPTSSHSLQRYTEQVGKIANLERVTDELIQDAGYVWSLIQQRLVQGVQREEEVQLLAGSGMPGVSGLLNRTAGFTAPQTITAVTNLQVPASGTPGMGATGATVASVTPGRQIKGASSGVGPTGLAIAEGILDALTDIRATVFFEPDAIVMNPWDYLTVRKSKDLNDQYYGGAFFGRDYGYPNVEGGSVQATSTFGLWGKRVVTTPAMPQGYILVGDFGGGWTRVLRRGGLRVDITNTNGTDFEQNLWTARAEERVGLMVERPELYELISLVNGS